VSKKQQNLEKTTLVASDKQKQKARKKCDRILLYYETPACKLKEK